ncbi:MAG TPA: ABC transporter substrate-binding protein [Casimicrobium sp.]|jgi:NitT/TauT family transport system substrate-binding protein|nr:ABC transporter substrate-binding protein [Casimicrobium sp.]
MKTRIWLSALLSCVAVTASAQTPIKFALDWRFEGPASPYFVALDKGYYKAEGLDVTIDTGNGSTEAINRAASGAYQFVFGDINTLVRFRDKPENKKLKMVLMVYNAPPFAIVSLKKGGISKPKDLEGKTLGAPAADGAYAQWPAFVKKNGIDVSKVKIENVGFPVREPMLVEGKVDAITGFSFSSYMNLRGRGIAQDDINVMLMRNLGLELYGNGIIVDAEYAAKNPKIVQGFIRATIKGWQETIRDPKASMASLMKRNNILNDGQEFVRLKMAIDQNVMTPEVVANGFGGVDAKRLTRSIDQIGEGFKYTNKPKADDIFDGAYLAPKAERMIKQ